MAYVGKKKAIQRSVNVARNIQHVDKPSKKKTTLQQGEWFVQVSRLKGWYTWIKPVM